MKTVSLELAKQLKEKGYPQDTYAVWEIGTDGNPYLEINYSSNDADKPRLFACPTADEILDNLPQILKIEDKTYQLFISMGLDRQYFIVYANEKDYHDNMELPIIMRKDITETLARMWIYLKENDLLGVK